LTAADPAKPTTLADVKPVLPEDLGAKPKAVEESKPTAVADAKPVKTAAKPAAPQKPSEPTLAGYAPDLTKPTPTSVSTGASTFARAEDYSWVQGRLFKVHSGGGYWQIRYQSHDQSDEYGGRFLLTGPAASDLKEGDVVRVEGVVQNYDDRHRTTSYRANNVKVIHKASGSPLAN
jgi:predicted extracellular nuclease